MASSTQFDIKINAKADTGSASKAMDDLNKSLGITAEREKELADMRKSFMSAAEAEVATVKKLTEAAQELARVREEETRRKPVFSTEQLAKEKAEMAKVTEETKKLAEANARLEAAAKRTAEAFAPKAANPWVTASQGLERLPPRQHAVAQSSRNMGNALLQGSRAIQDAQYGLGGVVNNLEGIASAFGMGAGVAGAVTVLAVAVQTLGPKVVEWFKSLDTEGAKLDQLKERFSGFADKLRGEFNPETERAEEISRRMAEAIKAEEQALSDATRAIDENLAALKRRNDIQAAADKQLEDAKIAEIRGNQNLSAEEKKRQEGLVRGATIAAEDARAKEEARAKEQAAAAKFVEAEKAAAANREAIAKREQDLRDAQTAAAYLDPKNTGSVTGLQEQINAQNAIPIMHDPAASRARDDRVKALQRTKEERQRFVDEFATRTGGATMDQISGDLDARRARQVELDRAIQDRARGVQSVVQTNREEAVAREAKRGYDLARVQRDTGVSIAENSPGRIPMAPGLLQGPGPLSSPLGSSLPTTAISNAAQAFQNPIDLSPLSQPLESLASNALLMRTQLEKQISEQGRRLAELDAKLKNNR